MHCQCTAHRYTTTRLSHTSHKRCQCAPGCRGFGPGSCNEGTEKAPTVAPTWLLAFRPAISY